MKRMVVRVLTVVGLAACSKTGKQPPDPEITARLENLGKGVRAVAAAAPLEAETFQKVAGVTLTFEDVSVENEAWNTGVLLISRYENGRRPAKDLYDIEYEDRWWRWPDAIVNHGARPDSNSRQALKELAAANWVLIVKPREVTRPKAGEKLSSRFTTFTPGHFEGEAHLVSLTDGTSRGGFRFTAASRSHPMKFDDKPAQEYLDEDLEDEAMRAAKQGLQDRNR